MPHMQPKHEHALYTMQCKQCCDAHAQSQGSCCFVDVNGAVTRTAEELGRVLPAALKGGDASTPTQLFVFDHVYGAEGNLAVLSPL